MGSQRIVLVGAFCGGVLAGGIAAALSDFGSPATPQDEAPRQAVQKAAFEASGAPRASGVHDGDAALKTKVVSAAVAAVGRSTEFVAPPAVAPAAVAPTPVTPAPVAP